MQGSVRRRRGGRLWRAVGACLVVVAVHSAAMAQSTAPADGSPVELKRLRVLGDASLRHGGDITCILPLSDGRRALVSAEDGTARLWDLQTGKELRRYPHAGVHYVWDVCLLPGQREFVTGSGSESVTRWDLDTAEIVKTYPHSSMVFRVAVSPDGRRLAATESSKLCILWDLQTHEEVRRFRGHKGSVYTVQFCGDGKRLATGSADGSVRLWDVATGQEKLKIAEKPKKDEADEEVYTLSVSPDKKRMLVCCAKKPLWLMDAETGESIWQSSLPDSVTQAAWSPDGEQVAALCGDRLYVLGARDGKEQWKTELPGGTHHGVAFSTDGKEVLCGASHLVCRFDVATHKRVFPPEGAPSNCRGVGRVIPVPGTKLLLLANDGDPGVRLANAETGEVERTFLKTLDISATAVSPDGRIALAGDENGAVWKLDLRTGEVLGSLATEGRASGVAFTDDGKHAMTASSGQGLLLWRLSDHKVERTFQVAEDQGMGMFMRSYSSNSLSVSDDGALAATTSWDDKLWIWSIAGGNVVQDLEEKDAGFRACAFAPSGGAWLIAVGDNGMYCYVRPSGKQEGLTAAQVKELISRLGAKKYKDRQEATEKLIEAGEDVLDALKAVDSDDPEVSHRVRKIRREIQKTLGKYRKTDFLGMEDVRADSFCFHPDGRRWALVRGAYATARITIGEFREGRLKVLRDIEDGNLPCVLRFSADGALYAGNANGTVSVYSLR